VARGERATRRLNEIVQQYVHSFGATLLMTVLAFGLPMICFLALAKVLMIALLTGGL
jgi:hypothetical protein